MRNLVKFFCVGVVCSLLVACQGQEVETYEDSYDTYNEVEEEEVVMEEQVDFKDHSKHIQFTLERFFEADMFTETTYFSQIGFGEPDSYIAYVAGTVPTRYDASDLERELSNLNLNAPVLVFFDNCQITFDPEYSSIEINFFYDLDGANCIEYHLDQPYDWGTDITSYLVFCVPSWVHEEYEFTYLVFNDGTTLLAQNSFNGDVIFNPTEEDFEAMGAILF